MCLPFNRAASRQLVLPFLLCPGENFRTVICNGYRMFEMSRPPAILSHGRPPVFQHFYSRHPGIDHRFNRQGHSGLESRPLAGLPVIWNLRRFVQLASDAVADKLAHNTEAQRLDP